MAGVIYKGVRATDGRKVQLSATDNPENSAGASILANELGAANGIATLDGSSLVVQEPASTSVSATINSIAKRDGTGDVLVPVTPTSQNAAASKSYTDALTASSRSWKELLLVPEQLTDGVSGGINQAFAAAIAVDLASGDTFIVTDGTTTETFTAVGVVTAAFEFIAGGGISATTANLVAAINTDSVLWSAVAATGLDTYFSPALDPAIVIYRQLPSAANADRCYGTIANAQADVQVLTFGAGTVDYSTLDSMQFDLSSTDPAFQYAGFGRIVGTLIPSETHRAVETSAAYTWDATAELWQQSSTPASSNPAKGSTTYAAAAPSYAEANGLLPSLGDFGYFYKGATDTVYHLFRRSIAAGTLADFGIVEMT